MVLPALPILKRRALGVMAEPTRSKCGCQAIDSRHEGGVGQSVVVVHERFASRHCLRYRSNNFSEIEVHGCSGEPDSLVFATLLVEQQSKQCEGHDQEKKKIEIQGRTDPVVHDG